MSKKLNCPSPVREGQQRCNALEISRGLVSNIAAGLSMCLGEFHLRPRR